MEHLLYIKITPIRELHYKDDSNWGLFACEVAPEDFPKVQLNKYGNITLVGIMPRLERGAWYCATVKEENNNKFGVQYKVFSIFQEIPEDDPDAQRAYLEAILTPYQFQALWKAYGGQDIIGMIQRDEIDVNKLQGIGEHTYKKIKERITENLRLQGALAKLSHFGLTYNTITKLVEHFNGSPELVLQKVEENPYVLCQVAGFGFKRVDPFALSMGIQKDSPHRIQSAIMYVLEDEASNKGHCWVYKDNLIGEVVELTDLPKEKIEEFMSNADTSTFHVEEDKIGLSKYYFYEKYIYRKMIELLEVESHVHIENLDEYIKQAEEEQGFQFTDEQRKAIELFADKNVVIVDGKAGTGKSTSLRGIYKVFAQKYEIAMCALSGKAAQRINETTGGNNACTIHRLLSWSPDTGRFSYNHSNPLPIDILIVDEMSMVDSTLFYHLISAVKPGTKVLLLGDTQQLPAIGVGSVFKDLINSGMIPHVTLSKVMRQAQMSGILSTANMVRDGKQFVKSNDYGTKVLGELKDLVFVGRQSGETVLRDVLELCKRFNGDIMDLQIIVPLKQRGLLSTKNLNKELQNIFNPYVDFGEGKILKRGETEFRIGDKVIQNGNNYNYNVFNGTIGRVVDINVDPEAKKREITIDFGDSGIVTYTTTDDINSIDLAYALTCHKYQGSQAKNVIVALDFGSYIMLSRQWLYTALTRASKKCFLIAQTKAVTHSVRTNLNDQRNTYLKSFFSNEYKN